MKKIYKTFLIFLVVITFFITGCAERFDESSINIAIFQHVEHTALDNIRKNIKNNLNKTYDNINIRYFNSQGDFSKGIEIINQINHSDFDVVIAIATPSAQLALQHLKNIPIVFSAVTDPVKAGLVESFNKPGQNITGVSDKIDSKQQINFLKTEMPNLENIGIIFNTSDMNSQSLIADLKSEAEKQNINIVLKGITSSIDVYNAALSIVQDIDIMFLTFDNTVASAFPALLQACRQFNKPLYVLDKSFVEQGADAGLSIDYSQLAVFTANIVEKIINGISPSEIPVKIITQFEIYYNQK